MLLAENKLQTQAGNILKAINLQDKFSEINNNVGGKQTTMDAKLNQLQSIAASLPFTVSFQSQASSMYSLHGVTGSTFVQRMFMVVEFDVKPASLNGIVWYFLSHTATVVSRYFVDPHSNVNWLFVP